jgi:hypothetical protein
MERRPMSRRIFLIFALPLAMFAAGCSQYVDDYDYAPAPALAQIPPAGPQDKPPVTVQASVIGIRRADKSGIPNSVELRMQIQDTGSQPVTFDPASLMLTNGQLLAFGPPLTSQGQVLTMSPGDQAMLEAYFPFPAGGWYDNTNLEALQLRWTVKIAGRPAVQVVYFRRLRYYNYDPYWGYPQPYWGWGGGVVIVHRR